MQIKDIENLAELAKLELSEEEKESLQEDLESILDYIRQIEEVKATEEKVVEKSTEAETKEVKSSLQNVWRKDEDEDEDQRDTTDLIYSQFPDSQDGFVKVKKIL